jgi:Protein of unknown function (DUF3175)
LTADLQDDKGLGPLFAAKSVESLSERHWGTPGDRRDRKTVCGRYSFFTQSPLGRPGEATVVLRQRTCIYQERKAKYEEEVRGSEPRILNWIQAIQLQAREHKKAMRGLMPAKKATRKSATKPERWVAKVTTDSTHPPEGLFTKSAETIAKTLAYKRVSPKGRSSGLRMLAFFINRGGRGLSASRRAELEKAKKLLSQRIAQEKKRAA